MDSKEYNTQTPAKARGELNRAAVLQFRARGHAGLPGGARYVKVLVTGGTGFVGRSVVRHLLEAGHTVRMLLHPGPRSPRLPIGVPVQVALASLADRRGVQAALVGMQAVVHLASAERSGSEALLQAIDVEGARALCEAAAQSGARRIIALSHLGADRASAYPVMRAKAHMEGILRVSGIPHTVLRSGVAFGEHDHFTTPLAMSLAVAPGFFPLIGSGRSRLQPIWVEDLATCVSWALDEPAMIDRTYEIGGPEHLTLEEIVGLVMQATGIRRMLWRWSPPYARGALWLADRLLRHPAFNMFWVDYLAFDRTASLDSVPRLFGLQPARMEARLGYLEGVHWGRTYLARQLARETSA